EGIGISSAFSFGSPQSVSIKNSIAAGASTADINLNGAGITAHVDHSNYDTPVTAGGATLADDGGNQTLAPTFANAAAGDFHEAAGSPTIDQGTSTDPLGLLGSAEVDNQARVQGAATDIGADEFVPPDTTAPDTAISKGPKKRSHKRKAKI